MSLSQISQLSLASAALYNGGSVPSPVVQNGNANPQLASEAAQMAQESSAVVLLGGDSSGFTTYDAAGLLNSFASAGTLQGSALTPGSGVNAQQSTDQQVMGQAFGNSGTAGTSAGLSSNWANVLQSNPALAGQAVQDNFNGSILDTLA